MGEIGTGRKRASAAHSHPACPKAAAVKTSTPKSAATAKPATTMEASASMEAAPATTSSAGPRRSCIIDPDRKQAGKKQRHQTRFDEGGHDELHGNRRGCEHSLMSPTLFNPTSTKLFPPAPLLRQRRRRSDGRLPNRTGCRTGLCRPEDEPQMSKISACAYGRTGWLSHAA